MAYVKKTGSKVDSGPNFVEYLVRHPEAIKEINRLHEVVFGKDGKSGILARKVRRPQEQFRRVKI